jgi:hypothetical protein
MRSSFGLTQVWGPSEAGMIERRAREMGLLHNSYIEG